MPYKKITKLTTGTGGVYLRDHDGASLEEGKTYVIKAHLKVSRIPLLPLPTTSLSTETQATNTTLVVKAFPSQQSGRSSVIL